MPHTSKLDSIHAITDYGAVGDGAWDCTFAIQAALDAAAKNGGGRIYVPAGTYLVTAPLRGPASGVTIFGAGRSASVFKNTATTDLFQLPAGVNKLTLEALTFTTITTSGHIFTPLGGVNTMNVTDCSCIQNNPAKSIWNGGDFGYIDNLWLGCILTHNGATSVPSFNLVTSTNAANSNTWMRCQCNHEANGAAVFFNVENDSAGAYNYANSWRDCTFELCNGGCIKLLTANRCVVDNCNVFDLTTTTVDLFTIGAGSGGLASRDNTIRDCKRLGGALGGGKFDVALQTGGKAVTTTIQGYNQSNGAGAAFDLQSNQRSLVIGCDNATITNKHQSTIVLDRGRFVGETVQVFVKAGTPIDGDFNITPGDGSFAVDSTANKIWVRIGGTWKGVVVA